MDGDLIDAVLKPFLDQLPMVSDERDIDEPDADEEVVFKTPIVGGSASLLSQRKLRSHLMNKIHAVDFKLDGSGVVNILDTDVTREPTKLELRKESTTFTEDGTVIIRRYHLTDEEHHRQMEKEIFEDTLTAEQKLRAGDPAASIEIVCPRPSRKLHRKRKRLLAQWDCTDHWGHGGSVHQAKDQGSGDDGLLKEASSGAEDFNGNIAYGLTEAYGAANAEELCVGSPKPDPPSLPAEAADQPMAKSGLPFKAPPSMLTTSPRSPPPQKSAASASSASSEPAPKMAKKEPPIWQVLLPRERVDLSPPLSRPEAFWISQMVLLLPGNGRAQGVHHSVHRAAWIA